MTNKTLRPAQSLSTIAIFRTSQRLIILKTSQLLQYIKYRYKLWDSQNIATCVIRRLAFCVWICIANLTTDFRKSFLWWAYHKLRCALVRKVVKGLLEKEVSQNGFAMSFNSQNAWWVLNLDDTTDFMPIKIILEHSKKLVWNMKMS